MNEINWKAEHERLSRYAARFDSAEEVRVIGDGTDLRLSIAGRRMEVDAGMGNMPGGEFFGCPVESSAEGTIAFTEFPQLRDGRQLRGVRLRFSAGRVVDASADAEEDFLIRTLDTDQGARRIGELGIGCNPGIGQYMGNVYFDEKIDGSVHIALGFGFADLGGTNESAIHWDLVKDLCRGGRIELDDRVGPTRRPLGGLATRGGTKTSLDNVRPICSHRPPLQSTGPRLRAFRGGSLGNSFARVVEPGRHRLHGPGRGRGDLSVQRPAVVVTGEDGCLVLQRR